MTRNSHRALLILCALLAAGAPSTAQTLVWTDITSSYALPPGIRLYRGERASPALRAFAVEVELNNPEIVVRPYIGAPQAIVPFLQGVGGLAGVNGGYFGGSTSYSAVVYPGEVRAQNISSVTRTQGTYTVTRSFFALDRRRRPSMHWIYHFSPALSDLYRFDAPTPNSQSFIAPAPTPAQGTRFDSLLTGIGGGPMLVKGGVKQITYDEEVFFGSGVDGELQNPRTAVGFTSSDRVIMLVADGRQAGSDGVTLSDLADILISRGCVEAMNLDGGGSTQMAAKTAAGYEYVDIPAGTRAVPTILAAVYADSLQGGKVPTFEKVIDTGDPECSLIGAGWFASANPGYWGATAARLAPISPYGDHLARFRATLPRSGAYDVYAWWVAASNRATDTPFLIHRTGGVDTIRVNQAAQGSAWNKIGTFVFSGDTADAVTISNAAATNQYVCADAVRFVSYDPVFTGVSHQADPLPGAFTLEQNYPNPFNPATTIRFSLPSASAVRLAIYDLLGREVETLVDGEMPPGTHSVVWSPRGLSSGVFFCRLSCGGESRVMSLVMAK